MIFRLLKPPPQSIYVLINASFFVFFFFGSNNKMKMKKLLTVLTGIIETFCVGNIIVGWSSMNFILTKEGYFGSNCNMTDTQVQNQSSKNGICPNQQFNLELVYTLALSLSAVITVAGGSLLDRYGTLFVRNLATIMLAVCCTLVAFSSPKTSWLLYPAMIGLATSGLFFYITNLQIANLFPRIRGTVVSIINGAVGASLVVFTIAQTAYENGVSLRTIFIFMAFLSLPMLLRSYFLMPKKVVPYNVPNNYSYGVKGCKKENIAEDEHLLQEQCCEETVDTCFEDNISDMSFKTCLLDVLYIFGTLSFVVQWVRVTVFVELLNAWLQYLIPLNPESLNSDITLFGYIQLIAFLLAPFNGAMFDVLYRYFLKRRTISTQQAKYKALAAVFLLSSLASITYSVFTLINSAPLRYATFVLVVAANTFPPANLSLLLIQCFPMDHFGRLYSLAILGVSVLTTLQYPLFYIGLHYFKGNFFVVNFIMLIVVLITLVQPVLLLKKSKQL